MDQRADLFAANGSFYIPFGPEVEYVDRHLVFSTLGDRLLIHNSQILMLDIFVGQIAIKDRVRILFRIIAEYAIDSGCFQKRVGIEFQGPFERPPYRLSRRGFRFRRPG